MTKTNMVKNMKKRSASEFEAIEKKTEISGNFNKNHKKKKLENGIVQNGQTNQQVKKDIPKKFKNEKKKDHDSKVVQSCNIKEINENNPQKNKKQISNKENKLEMLKKREEYRKKRKANRQMKHEINRNLSVEEIKKKIQIIEARQNLTKSARRKLAALKKRLRMEEGVDKPKQIIKKEIENIKSEKSIEFVKKKQLQNTEQKKIARKIRD